jgi:hypothetical protein
MNSKSEGQPIKYPITFEIKLQSPSTALFDIVAGLHQLSIEPESLIWTTISGTDEARVWLIIEVDPARWRELIRHFQSNRAIKRIVFVPDSSAKAPAQMNFEHRNSAAQFPVHQSVP